MYLIGVSSGIFGAVPETERVQLAGLSRKAQYCITKGVQFVQIDLESISEFKEANLKESMEAVRRMNVLYGLHSETKAYGVEVAEPDSAIGTDYKVGHERLFEILNRAGEIESRYVLIHSSESEPFPILERTLQPAYLIDPSGRELKDFLLANESLMEWLMGGDMRELPSKIFEKWKNKVEEVREKVARGEKVEEIITEKDLREVIKSPDYIWREILGVSLPEAFRRRIEDIVESLEIEFKKSIKEIPKEVLEENVYPRVKRRIEILTKDYYSGFLDHIQSRSLHYGPERIAYYIIAKWMEENRDPLWTNIINSNIEYFAKTSGLSKEEWLRKKKIEKVSIEDDIFRNEFYYLWVPAVSARYIYGHLVEAPKFGYPDLKEPIKKYKMPLVLETPMAHRGTEEWLRLPNPIQMYWLVKRVNEEVGFECLAIAMDFEHMLSIKLEPKSVIECLPSDGGKHVRVIHAGWPSPLAPAHLPIPVGSEQQRYLYDLLYHLRQKGFGKDDEKEYYIVFERGGGPDPIQQSIIALREIVDQLIKDVPPDKLPPEFYGVKPEGFLSPERQKAIIKEHGLDPLKGLLTVPEEEYTFLGKAALEKGVPPEKWKKEELK